MEEQLDRLAATLGRTLQERGLAMATAESCTGGWVAKVLTDIPGCSAWFERGFVTYSNEAKHELLGVRIATLDAHGAVSAETVREMVAGALAHSRAGLALAISGIAGPGGGTPEKPVGTVWFAWGGRDDTVTSRVEHLPGDREGVRRLAVATALQGMLDYLD
ncbi:MAG TPA: nicotinamide-nucleotide amidase [Sedimenticola thiotaurini]|uniref:Nicotinamide-nucleotide amidase n=1 Tax=Sedimenticola thiotaurini TaxID=1543721 RepID=A0A831W6P1_9GAMM|nr:nicotinamide-nucleotide amidase [Sedimenticola thiotaurini]